MRLSRYVTGLLLGISALSVLAHSGESHDPGIDVDINQHATPPSSEFPIPFGGDFELVDHHGNVVTQETYKGRHMLVFFGYISCKNMCSISLTRVGKALELIGADAAKLHPLVITVDPQRDTPAVLKKALVKYHPRLTGLTGSTEQLRRVYNAYRQQPVPVADDWEGDAVISHSSYIYLLDHEGRFKTLFPPILSPQSMADIMRKYVDKVS